MPAGKAAVSGGVAWSGKLPLGINIGQVVHGSSAKGQGWSRSASFEVESGGAPAQQEIGSEHRKRASWPKQTRARWPAI
jgi:hypothetical protein